jgi:hypothetical protein
VAALSEKVWRDLGGGVEVALMQGPSLDSVQATIRGIAVGLTGNDELCDDQPLMDAG